MTHLLPTGVEVDYWVRFCWMVGGVFLVLICIYRIVESLEDLRAKRWAETPEPKLRQQLNTVIQFPTRRMQ